MHGRVIRSGGEATGLRPVQAEGSSASAHPDCLLNLETKG